MSLTSLGLASEGLLDRGGLPSLHIGTLGHLRSGGGARPIGGDDAPPVIGKTGEARKWLRDQVGGDVYSSVRAAMESLERALKRPSKKKVATANRAIQRAKVAALNALEPTVRASLIGAAGMNYDSAADLKRAFRQLGFVMAQIEAFRRREAQEEEAIVMLLSME